MELLVLDGAQSIGGTKLYLRERGTGILLDYGVNYGRWGCYFEEYLKPRVGRGLYDLWMLDLIPKVAGLYRDDLFPADFRPSYHYTLDVQALFLSHAHLDHCGLVGLVRDDIPLYASALSAALMKGMQDSGKLDYYGEIAYRNPRFSCKANPLILETRSREPYRGRLLYTVQGGAPASLQRFWSMPPNPKALQERSRAKRLKPQPLVPAGETIHDIRFRAFPVDHSIPGATAFCFETADGPVVYTGDLRLHGTQGEETRRFVEAMVQERPYLLIIEGTRLGREGGENVTEQQVLERALDIVQKGTGRLVVADFGPRHIERLSTFLTIARQTDRQLLVTTRDGYLLEALSAADPQIALLSDPALGIFDQVRLETKGWETEFRQRHSGKLVQAETVRQHPGDYILAFSFYDMNDLLDIHPQGGIYIYSSSEAYGEDQRVDLWRLWNWLRFYQMEVYGLRWEGGGERGYPIFPEPLHASGHISANDLLWCIREMQPHYLLPVHTEHRAWFGEQLRGEPIRVVYTADGEWFRPE